MDQSPNAIVHNDLPQPRKWLKLKGRFRGWGEVYFRVPKGTLGGNITVLFNELGEVEIEIEVKQLTIEGSQTTEISLKSFSDFIANVDGPEDLFRYPVPSNNPCEKVTVSNSKGTYIADKIGSYFVEGVNKIKVYPISSEFRPKLADATEKYFVMPLLNFVPNGISFESYGLIDHPLRIYTFPILPENPSKTQEMTFRFNIANKRFLYFRFRNGKDAFIEPLPDFPKRREKLFNHKCHGLVTAVLVGEVDSLSDFAPDLSASNYVVPKSLLSLLSLATGSEVGTPWLEFRNIDGKLVRRIHYTIATSPFRKGLGAISVNVPSEKGNIGRLLEQAQISPNFTKQYVRTLISQIVLSGALKIQGNIEDQMSHVFRGLELLCDMRRRERGKGKLEDSFSNSEVVAGVTILLNETIERLNEITKALPKKDPNRQEVGNIRGRIKALLEPELGFGKLIVDLLRQNNLHDHTALEAFYGTHPYKHENTWIDSVVNNNGRNDIFHRAWFNWDTDPPEIAELAAISYHLRDILIRVILIALNYDGHYQPQLVNLLNIGSQPLDWVKPDTDARYLGYERTSEIKI